MHCWRPSSGVGAEKGRGPSKKRRAGADRVCAEAFICDKKYDWRPDLEIQMLKIMNRNIRGAAASEGGGAALGFFVQF